MSRLVECFIVDLRSYIDYRRAFDIIFIATIENCDCFKEFISDKDYFRLKDMLFKRQVFGVTKKEFNNLKKKSSYASNVLYGLLNSVYVNPS